jgi:hypothetical protein
MARIPFMIPGNNAHTFKEFIEKVKKVVEGKGLTHREILGEAQGLNNTKFVRRHFSISNTIFQGPVHKEQGGGILFVYRSSQSFLSVG